MRKIMFVWCLGMLISAALAAQPLDASPPPDANTSEASAPEENAPSQLKGDVVVFKKGTELRGVKVVRQTPLYVEIEYLPGEPYLQIPTTQISNVIYADKGTEQGGKETEGVEPSSSIMPGEEVSAEFHQKLTSVLSETPLVYENKDCLEVVYELMEKAKVQVDVDQNLKSLPAEQRLITHTVEGGGTLLDFLLKDLAEIAPNVRVILRYDKLSLQQRLSTPPAPEEESSQP